MLKFYTVDDRYSDYLKRFDSNVMSNYNSETDRPYVGLLFKINSYNYYAPMTSPKPKHLTMKNMLDFEKIDNGLYGAINLNNMIPVKQKVLSYIDINSITDVQYKNLLDNQFRWISKNNKRIIDKAKKLYNFFVSNTLNISIKSRCCNFTLLEEKSRLYIPEFYIYQDKESDELVVSGEEKNEARYNLYETIVVPNDKIGIVKDAKLLSDKTTFSLIDENDKNLAFYSTISKKVCETIDKLIDLM